MQKGLMLGWKSWPLYNLGTHSNGMVEGISWRFDANGWQKMTLVEVDFRLVEVEVDHVLKKHMKPYCYCLKYNLTKNSIHLLLLQNYITS